MRRTWTRTRTTEETRRALRRGLESLFAARRVLATCTRAPDYGILGGIPDVSSRRRWPTERGIHDYRWWRRVNVERERREEGERERERKKGGEREIEKERERQSEKLRYGRRIFRLATTMTARVLSPRLTSLRYHATGDAVFLRFSWFDEGRERGSERRRGERGCCSKSRELSRGANARDARHFSRNNVTSATRLLTWPPLPRDWHDWRIGRIVARAAAPPGGARRQPRPRRRALRETNSSSFPRRIDDPADRSMINSRREYSPDRFRNIRSLSRDESDRYARCAARDAFPWRG